MPTPDLDPQHTNLRRIAVFFDVVKILFVAVLVVAGIRFFVAQPFIVTGDSMSPAFNSGDYLIVDELSYEFNKPARGDIVVFHYPLDPSLFFIKRVVGLPGDTVAVDNGSIFIQTGTGQVQRLLNEPYINTPDPKQETSTTTLGADEYFVLGDNRNASFDSRIWGPVPGRYIVGRAALRVYPFSSISLFPGAYTFAPVSTSSKLSTGK